jgi:hypothetical protein
VASICLAASRLSPPPPPPATSSRCRGAPQRRSSSSSSSRHVIDVAALARSAESPPPPPPATSTRWLSDPSLGRVPPLLDPDFGGYLQTAPDNSRHSSRRISRQRKMMPLAHRRVAMRGSGQLGPAPRRVEPARAHATSVRRFFRPGAYTHSHCTRPRSLKRPGAAAERGQR